MFGIGVLVVLAINHPYCGAPLTPCSCCLSTYNQLSLSQNVLIPLRPGVVIPCVYIPTYTMCFIQNEKLEKNLKHQEDKLRQQEEKLKVISNALNGR